MMTYMTLKQGLRSNLTLTKDSQVMISYDLFSYLEAKEPIIREIEEFF